MSMFTNVPMQWALDAQSRGWHIFPCEPDSKTGALLQPGKPWRIKWYESATNDLTQILTWWTTEPRYNIGVSCKKSGLVVVDCDVPKELPAYEDGWDQFKALTERRGAYWEDTIDTYMVETASGGVHLYYRWPDGVQASQGSLCPLVDVRSNGGEKGGYVIGAGSYAGNWYRAVNQAPVRNCPAWLVEEIRAKPHVRAPSNPFARPGAVSDAGLHNFVRNAAVGGRNAALFWAAAQKVQETPDISVDELHDLFVQDAEEVGLTPPEIRATIRSAYNKAKT